MFPKEKEGKDCGINPIDKRGSPPDPNLPPKEYDICDEIQDKTIEYDGYRTRMYNDIQIPLPHSGIDQTKWEAVLQHGISVDNVQKPATTFKFNLKDS